MLLRDADIDDDNLGLDHSVLCRIMSTDCSVTGVRRWYSYSAVVCHQQRFCNVGDLLANSVLYGTKAATKYELCAFHSTLLSERPMQWKRLLVCRS